MKEGSRFLHTGFDVADKTRFDRCRGRCIRENGGVGLSPSKFIMKLIDLFEQHESGALAEKVIEEYEKAVLEDEETEKEGEKEDEA